MSPSYPFLCARCCCHLCTIPLFTLTQHHHTNVFSSCIHSHTHSERKQSFTHTQTNIHSSITTTINHICPSNPNNTHTHNTCQKWVLHANHITSIKFCPSHSTQHSKTQHLFVHQQNKKPSLCSCAHWNQRQIASTHKCTHHRALHTRHQQRHWHLVSCHTKHRCCLLACCPKHLAQKLCCHFLCATIQRMHVAWHMTNMNKPQCPPCLNTKMTQTCILGLMVIDGDAPIVLHSLHAHTHTATFLPMIL